MYNAGALIEVVILQGDGNVFFGLHVENGRIKGEAKKALREVIEKFKLDVHITPNQNLILCNVRPSWKARITRALANVGLLVSNEWAGQLFHNCDSSCVFVAAVELEVLHVRGSKSASVRFELDCGCCVSRLLNLWTH